MKAKSCFGAYDIRGIYPETVNEELAYRIGRFLPGLLRGKKFAVGRDVRLSGGSLCDSLIKGLMESGCEVHDIGLCGTEMIYFAVPHLGLDGGIMITASHNPKEYNGFKFVKKNSVPLEKELFKELEQLVLMAELPSDKLSGTLIESDVMSDYVAKMLSYVDVKKLKPFRVVVHAGNGTAGPVIEAMEKHLPFEFIKIDCKPDGTFPHGVPNPLLPENRAVASDAVKQYAADFGVAWDGDFDRCFIYDETGRFIDSCYLVGFLAEAFLSKEVGAGIVHDPRAIFNIEDTISVHGGISIICRGGHVFFKAKMRETGAIYGGELSAHHYFRDFYYCDSGMIPWLLVAEFLSVTDKRLFEILDERIKRFPVSGEQNLRVENADQVIRKMECIYGDKGCVSKIDGLSVDMGEWRFNVRASHTEPLLRLNVESKVTEGATEYQLSTLVDQLIANIEDEKIESDGAKGRFK